MNPGYVDTPEGLVHYRTEGSGEPLLLLHQVGLSSDQFTEMMPIFSKTYRVIAMDLPGYGSSYLPAQAYTVEDYARNVMHFLDALHIEQIGVVGRYLGASVAVEMAAAHPARINKLVLFGCVYEEPASQEERLNFYRGNRMQIKGDGSHLMSLWQHHLSRPHFDLETVQRAVVDYLKSGMGIRAEDGHVALYTYDIESRLSGIKSPTLLLYGAADRIVSRLEVTSSLVPRCRAKVIDGVRAFPTWEKPREIARVILEFLENPGV